MCHDRQQLCPVAAWRISQILSLVSSELLVLQFSTKPSWLLGLVVTSLQYTNTQWGNKTVKELIMYLFLTEVLTEVSCFPTILGLPLNHEKRWGALVSAVWITLARFCKAKLNKCRCCFLYRDTAGQERFRTITTAYYRGAMVSSYNSVVYQWDLVVISSVRAAA